MQSDRRLFDDLARVASGAVGALTGVRDELETRMREQVERILGHMNLVRREEFDAVQAMAAKARMAQEELERRLTALEARLGGGDAGPRPPGRRLAHMRPAVRKARPVKPL
jgi:BMFP domain-containing protein YqiC